MALDMDFVALPKIELHAHLSGSISRRCLHDIWLEKRERPGATASTLLRDPLEEMPEGKFDYDLNTQSTDSVLEDFAADGCVYLELRTTPRAIPEENITRDDYVSLILNCIETSPTKTRMMTNLILSIDRRNTAEQALAVVDLAIKHRQRGIVAIDLCGDPSCGDISIFREAFSKAKQAGLKITIHFAEIPSHGAPGGELAKLLDFQPDRIGHVIHVPEDIKEVVRQRKLGLELCLSCNVHAKMMVKSAGSYADHHLGEWLASPCPLTLCTDDVGVFGSALSKEYRLAAEHFALGRSDIVALARRGIEAIFAPEDEKARLRSLMWSQ